ncbi:MAG TPA: DUF1513 domain-containing protein, partial [Kaistiaceae bacterium]|nr:DUF1513 domain-containing protein [Kaistiaceae bacterium]
MHRKSGQRPDSTLSTAIDRRRLLALLGAAGLAPLAPRPGRAVPATAYLSAARLASGRHAALGLDAAGSLVFSLDLPERAHDIAISPDRRHAVAFARRPDRFAVVLDIAAGRVRHRFDAVAGRHFFGHGFFSPDGRLLYATENDYDGEAGAIGVYDTTAGWRRVGEIAGVGTEPHEATLLSDGRTIVAADGGILTHPDYGREKLNLATMAPALVYVDRDSGEVLETARLDPALHRLSIRHLACEAAGTVWFGCQYEGDPGDDVGLVGRHRRGEAPELVALPGEVTRALKQYVGSVAVNRAGTRIAVTSPRGGRVVVLD